MTSLKLMAQAYPHRTSFSISEMYYVAASEHLMQMQENPQVESLFCRLRNCYKPTGSEYDIDRSVLNGTNREDNINEQVKELENAIDKLRGDFDRANTWQETREQVQRVLTEADEVNAIVRRGRWRRGGTVKSEWALVRNDLNRLAGVYNLPLLRA